LYHDILLTPAAADFSLAGRFLPRIMKAGERRVSATGEDQPKNGIVGSPVT
jgi:hypothetical protein